MPIMEKAVESQFRARTSDDDELQEYMDKWLDDLAKKPADSWAVPAIEYCLKTRMMVGDDNGNFRPQSYLRREEMAAILKGLITGTKE